MAVSSGVRTIASWATGLVFLWLGISTLLNSRSASESRFDATWTVDSNRLSATPSSLIHDTEIPSDRVARIEHTSGPNTDARIMREQSSQLRPKQPPEKTTDGPATTATHSTSHSLQPAIMVARTPISATTTTTTFMLVTACSESHLCALMQLLASLNESAEGAPIIVYDLNPPPGPHMQLEELRRAYQHVVAVRRFPYNEYPAFFNVLKRAGQWAWKPVIIKTVVDEFGSALWLDTGAVMLKGRKLSTIRTLVDDGNGFYSAVSRGTTFQFVHHGTWAYFGLAKCCNAIDRGTLCCCCSGWTRACLSCGPTIQADDHGSTTSPSSNGEHALTEANMTWWREVGMCNGAIIVFARSGRAYDDLLVPWVECAKTEKCISPSGSHRGNHRQDQAALTFIAALAGFPCTTRSIDAGFALHKDEVVNHTNCELLLGRSIAQHGRIM